MIGTFHEPVMVVEVLHYLALRGGVVVDGTVGGGGHAEAVLNWCGPSGEQVERLIGIDRDPAAISEAGRRLGKFGKRVKLIRGCFDELGGILDREGMKKVEGILLDLGASRYQLTESVRGGSLLADGPLDMRMDPDQVVSAAALLAEQSERSLARLLREYGEERFARGIAKAVVERRKTGRPVQRTRELAELVSEVVPRRKHGHLHPATRTFMALRIAVNEELTRLEKVLAQLPERLSPGSRAVVISYHSLEDRRVKQAFLREARGCVCPSDQPVCSCGRKPRLRVLTRRPVQAGGEEVLRNPASRSARLRAAERLEEGKE